MRLNLNSGKRVRKDSDGTVWMHFRCPSCEDPSYHLGVGILKTGKVVSKCLRCGRKLPKSTRYELDGKVYEPDVIGAHRLQKRTHAAKRNDAVQDMPGVPLAMAGDVSVLDRWPSLPADKMIELGIRSDLESTLFCPVWTVNGWGYIERRLDGNGPKAKNHGPKGVGFLREVNPGDDGPWVLVEGWFDAVAVPPPYEPVILRGTSNWPAVSGDVYVALDGDQAGMEGTKRLIRRFLKNGQKVHICKINPGKDPADEGMAGMLRVLEKADKIEDVKEYLRWLTK